MRTCPGCHHPTAKRTGYCTPCHAAWQRAHRRRHSELSETERMKANARAQVGVYLRRGLLTKTACWCGSTEVEAHHEDYARPREVVWLCRGHHLAEHGVTVAPGLVGAL